MVQEVESRIYLTLIYKYEVEFHSKSENTLSVMTLAT